MPIVRRKGSPFYWYDFRFRGRRYRGTTGETVKSAARVFETKLLAQIEGSDSQPAKGKKPPLLRDFIPQFLASFEANQLRATKTKLYYQTGARLILATALPEFPIDRIMTSTVASVSWPHSAYTANNAVRTLRRILGHAVELGYLRTVPKMHLARETARDQIFTPEFEERLLTVAPQPLKDVFTILMDTGMRPEEVYRMRWDHVLWLENLLRVTDGKTDAARREIGMSARVLEILRSRVRSSADSPWVFPSRRGGHIATVNKAFAIARNQAGLPASLVLYATRHTFGTDVMAATGNQKLTMTTMGHADIKTSTRYQHPTTGQIARVIDERNAQRKSATTQNGHTFGHTELPM